ncbi:MAG: hypothetical protein LBJ31_00450 [Treponema sp.]|jgi:hypothetical protein|nr:hypothetical protein [Treponema sp.]
MTGKRKFLLPAGTGFLFVSILGILGVSPAFAQTPADGGMDSRGRAFVAVLSLAGEETEMIRRFHNEIVESVTNLQKYSPRAVSVPFGARIPTDMPPVPSLANGARYALTGGVYPGEPAGEYYLQLWLWDMTGSTMIYTDDLVYDDIDEAMESVPGLVEWLFSHIHELSVETPAADAWPDPLFMIGVRAGLSQRWYIKPEERSPGASAVNLEGGVSGALRLNSLFSAQLEFLLTRDVMVYRGLEDSPAGPVLKNKKYTNFSLGTPVLLKMNFRVGKIRFSPLAGAYAVIPLGKTSYRDENGNESKVSWSVSNPLGFTAGFEGAAPAGSGMVVVGLRYVTDFGLTSIDGGREYRRNAVSLYLSYEFGFLEGKRLFKKSAGS